LHLRINTTGGGFDVINSTASDWNPPHPEGDDVAIAPIGGLNAQTFRYSYIPIEMAATPEMFADEALSPGDEAFFIGRYIDHEGKTMNTPTVRFGTIAQQGGDPVWQGPRNRYQESILIEVHSLSGFSGSPVFAYRGARIGRAEGLPENAVNVIGQGGVASRVYLLGVDWGSHPWQADVLDPVTNRPEQPPRIVKASSGLAMVVPIWKLRHLLNDPKYVALRAQAEEAALKYEQMADTGAVMDSAEPMEVHHFDRQDFMDSLGKATRRVTPPDESSPEGSGNTG